MESAGERGRNVDVVVLRESNTYLQMKTLKLNRMSASRRQFLTTTLGGSGLLFANPQAAPSWRGCRPASASGGKP